MFKQKRICNPDCESRLTTLVLSLQQIAPDKQTLCPEDLCNILYFFTLPDFTCTASYISEFRPLNGYQGCLCSQWEQCTFCRPCLVVRVLSHCKHWANYRQPLHFSFFFLLSTFFNYFHTQHHYTISIQNKQNTTKQRPYTPYSKSRIKREREREKKNQKFTSSHSFIQSRILEEKHCQASIVEGLAPFIRAVVHSQVTICRKPWIQYVFPHMCGVNQFCIIVFAAVKPANNILFCIKLIQRPESSRRHKLGLANQSICSKEDKTRFTCVQRLMTMGHSQNICRKVPDDAVLHIWQFKFGCSFILNLL